MSLSILTIFGATMLAATAAEPASWNMSPHGGCEIVYGTPDPEGPGLVAFMEVDFDPRRYVLIAWNSEWTFPPPGQRALEIGFDGEAPRALEAHAWLVEGVQLFLEMDAGLRELASRSRAMDYHVGGRRIGSIPLDNFGPTLARLEACLEEQERTTTRLEVVDVPPK